MRKHLAALAIVASMTLSLSAYASETDPGSMSLDELKTAYTQLESEKTQIESEKNQLESENADLKAQIEKLTSTEAETEPSTEIVGTQYTDSATVQIVQKALNDAGFDCGTPDGKAGSKTVEALKAYQKFKGINANGVITDELLDALGVADQVSDAAKQEAAKAEYSTFRGKVLQEGAADDTTHYIRFAVDSNYDTVIFVTYSTDLVSARILDDDILTIYGTVVGDYSYEAVMGNEITLPWINADIIDTSEVNMG